MKIYDRTNAISKAQVEVWEIREKILEDTLSMSVEERINFVAERAKRAYDVYKKMITEKKNHTESRVLGIKSKNEKE